MRGKYPFETQRDLKDCGVCSLLIIVRYFGGSVSKEYLRELTNTTKSGVTAYDLINGAKKLGFDSYGVKGSVEDILPPKYLVIIERQHTPQSFKSFCLVNGYFTLFTS